MSDSKHEQSAEHDCAHGHSHSHKNRFRPLVIVGPSAVGKGTLVNRLLEELRQWFGFSISHTTRAPRAGEAHGVNYYFVDRAQMEKEIQDNMFIEHAVVHGNLYGTSVMAVENVMATGKICLLELDIQGAASIKKTDLNPYYIFIAPPSFEELERRLRARKTEDEASTQRRLETARRELELAKMVSFDYTLVNDDLEMAYAAFRNLILQWYPHITIAHGNGNGNGNGQTA